MKTQKIFLTLIITGISLFVNSQNLVLNPSFEDIYSLYYSQQRSKDGLFNATHWFSSSVTEEAGLLSKLYDSIQCPHIPGCYAKYDGLYSPHSGNNCIDFIPFSVRGSCEYITATLSNALEKDSTYLISFYTKNAQCRSGIFFSYIDIKFHKERKLFPSLLNVPFNSSDDRNYSNRYKNQKLYADASISLESVNKDTSWCKMTVTYTAKGGELFMTFGVFYNDKLPFRKMKRYNKETYLSKNREKQTIKENMVIKKIKNDKNHYYYACLLYTSRRG